MHVVQGVWTPQNFEEILVICVACNIQQCKNGCCKGKIKNVLKFLFLGCGYIKIQVLSVIKHLYLIRPLQFNQISSPLLD